MDLLARFVGIWMVFVIYFAVGVEGVAHGASCTGTGTGDCTEKTNTVCNSTCKCTTNSFRKTTPECAIKIALTKACTTGQPTDQCADSNAECDGTALTCGCKSAHFVSKTGACNPVVAALNGACDASDSASDQCAVANSECRNDGTDKCLCKATYYVNVAACAIRKKPDEACTANQCVTHATCDTTGTNKCVCNAGYNPSPTISPTTCSGVAKVITLPYTYVVPILVSMMFLLR